MTTAVEDGALAADDTELDAVRQLVLDRTQERRLTLADLSRAIGRNAAYMHQFIWRGSPRHLAEQDRKVIAGLLLMPEDILRPGAPVSGIDLLRIAPPIDTPAVREPKDVPVYREGQYVDPATAVDWAPRPPGADGGPTSAWYAVWISRSHGRLRPGDLAYVKVHQPPRVGDLVVAVEGRQHVAIGELVALADETATIATDATHQSTVELGQVILRKICVITLG